MTRDSPEICEKCQALIDKSNSHTLTPKAEFEDDEIETWNDSVETATDESIELSIKSNNAIINHFEKCSNKGCKELMENWKPYSLYTDRESMLT